MLTEAESRDIFKNAYLELFDAIEKIRNDYETSSKDNYPTPKWVAGKFQQLQFIPSIEQSIKSGKIENPEKQEEYQKIIALKDISLKYGFIKKKTSDSGSINYIKTDKGSQFIQSLSSSFMLWKDLASKFREANDDETREWINKLDAEDKEIVNIYSNISAKNYAFLMGLINKQQSKENYTDFIHNAIEKDPNNIESLQSLGLITKDYTLNLGLIRRMLDFLTDKTYARLKPLNKEISYITDRIAADKALLNNFLERNIDRTSYRRTGLAQHADKLIDGLDNIDKMTIMTKYKGGNIRGKVNPDLITKKIIDKNGSLTDLGRYIAVVISKLDKNSELEQHGERPTTMSRIRQSDSDGSQLNQLTRKNQRANSRNNSFKNFLKQ